MSELNFLDTGGNKQKINTPAVNSIAFNTANTERVRIDSSGRVLIGTTDPGGGNADDLTVATSGNTGITIRSGTSNTGNIFWSDATSGADQYIGALEYHHSDNQFKFNISNTTRMTVDSTGDVTISDGDLVIGTSGHGIDFSATGGGSNTSNESELFSDYEQGSCAILIQDATGSNISVTGGNHKYTRMGNKVFVEGYFTFAESGSKNGGLMTLYQLPFTPAQVNAAGGNYWYDGPSDALDITGLVYIHTNGSGYLKQSTTQGQNSNQKYLTFNEIAANSNRTLFVSFCYTV